MTSFTRVKIVKVPNVVELNAILFDLQQEQSNIIKVDLIKINIDGTLEFFIQYHQNILNTDEPIMETKVE